MDRWGRRRLLGGLVSALLAASLVLVPAPARAATCTNLFSSAFVRGLEQRYPGIAKNVVTEDGALHRLVNVYVNDEDVRYLGSLETSVEEGDTVSILPAVAGG